MKRDRNEVKKDLKNFFKKHWREVLLAGGAVASGVILKVILGSKCDVKSTASLLNDLLIKDAPEVGPCSRKIDEAIFTDLAPLIEDAVFNKDLEKIMFDRSYDLGDNVHKLVTTTIETIYGD